MQINQNNERFLEIDFLRGIGIIMMIVFHFFFDLNYFNIVKNELYEGFWLIFQRTTASLLILVFGISLAISYEKTRKDQNAKIFLKYLKRSLFLFLVAAVITIATWIYPHDGFIIFGIIHFFALSVLLGYFFLRFFYLNLVFGIATILIGLAMNSIAVNTNLLLWLGLTFPGFYTLDYFPILPWFGIVLIGIFLGKYAYPENQRKINIRIPTSTATHMLAFLGRNSLIIYLIHQPIIIGFLQLIK